MKNKNLYKKKYLKKINYLVPWLADQRGENAKNSYTGDRNSHLPDSQLNLPNALQDTAYKSQKLQILFIKLTPTITSVVNVNL